MRKRKSRRRIGGRRFDCSNTRSRRNIMDTLHADLRDRPQSGITPTNYCRDGSWFENGAGGVTSNGRCDDIPLLDIYPNYRQFALGRMHALYNKNYYNCQSRFRTLEVRNWSMDLNDLFIRCSEVDKQDYDFPIRIITDYNPPGDYVPEIVEYDADGNRHRASGMQGYDLFGYHGVTPGSRGIDSLHPMYGSLKNVIMNREICQLYSQGIKLWQCINSGFEYLYFGSYKQNYDEYTTPFEPIEVDARGIAKCKISDGSTIYEFIDVTFMHHCDNYS